jgi:hypothetical protein
MVFIGAFALTILSLVVAFVLALNVPEPSGTVERLIETCSTTWKMGFGAVIGLLGGKVLP